MMRHFTLQNLVRLETERTCWEMGPLTILGDRFTDTAACEQDCIDCAGLFAIPGLIDVHTHVFGESDTSKATQFSWTESETAAFDRAEKNARAFLRFGVTAIRDLGGYGARCFEFKRRIETGLVRGPRFFTAGQFITTPVRTDHWFGYLVEPPNLIDAVVDLCSRDADWIKIINDPLDFDSAALCKAVQVAHQRGSQVAIHAYSEEATVIAMSAGADSIEHSAVGWASVLAHPRIRAVYFVPTVVCSADVVADPIGSLIHDDVLLKIFQDWNREQLQLLPAATDPSIRIAVGTDTGFPPTQPGLSLHREMQLLCQLGFEPLSVLRRATALNAQLLRSPTIGTLTAGCYADFVLVDGNPANMGEFYQSIVSVFLGGQCVHGTDFTIR